MTASVRTFGDRDLFHFMGAAAFAAARETGLLAALLAALLAGAATPEQHAGRLGLYPRFTTRILDVLVALGFARKKEDRYGGSSYLYEWDRLLPGGVVNHAEFWSHASDCLRTGEPFLRMDGDPHCRELSYQTVVARLGVMFESAAAYLADKLPGSPERVLDVGVGSGVWSLAMAECHNETRVVALDLPAVLEAFRHRAVGLGLDDRAETLPGNYYEVELPPACFDRVIIANVLHLKPPSRARVLISRLAPTLRSGGDLIVVDSFGGGTPERAGPRHLRPQPLPSHYQGRDARALGYRILDSGGRPRACWFSRARSLAWRARSAQSQPSRPPLRRSNGWLCCYARAEFSDRAVSKSER